VQSLAKRRSRPKVFAVAGGISHCSLMLPPCLATGFSANKPETIVDISSRSLWRKLEVPVSHEEYSNL
jgi:hypothetical protein